MKYKIGLIQINNSFSGQNYFPYAVGLLQSYVEKHCSNISDFEFIDTIYKRISVTDAVEKLKTCSIVGFSLYVWNERISLKIAEKLKSVNPSCLIIFGGPQVPDNCEEFKLKHKFIDICVHGEGEGIFSMILEKFDSKDWSTIPSITYTENDKVVTKPKAGRFKVLDEIPSPYLNNVFNSIITNNPNERWLGLWETNRGCPFTCTYCDWGSATAAKVSQFDIDRLYNEVDWFSNHKVEFIFCCDANYGMLPRDLNLTQKVVDNKKKSGYPHALSVQNTKNATERAYQVQKLLASEGLNKGVTLSVQSMDKTTLKNIRRDNISLDSYQELQRRFMKDKIETYSDMILGMPGETYDSFVSGIDELISNGQHNRIQFNNLSILPNAQMGDIEYQKKFGMEVVESNIINIHGSLEEEDENFIQEKQVLVISTNSTPKEDWKKTRAICWMVALLHFDKILQIPLILTNKLTGISYKSMFIHFMNDDIINKYPIVSSIKNHFITRAEKIQNGESEFFNSMEYLNIWWPDDEFIFIELVKKEQIKEFYEECYQILLELTNSLNIPINTTALYDAINLNRHLIKVPFEFDDVEISTNYDIMKIYKDALEGNPFIFDEKQTKYTIEKSKTVYTDWNKWYKEVVWYGNKKGAYLHGNYKTEYQLSGHY